MSRLFSNVYCCVLVLNICGNDKRIEYFIIFYYYFNIIIVFRCNIYRVFFLIWGFWYIIIFKYYNYFMKYYYYYVFYKFEGI